MNRQTNRFSPLTIIFDIKTYFRTTLGMIVACLIKEIQVSTELRKMADIHLVPQQTIDDLIMKKFNAPLRRKPDDDDPVSEKSNLEANT